MSGVGRQELSRDFRSYLCSWGVDVSVAWKVAIDSHEISLFYSEEIPDDFLGFVSVEVLAGEDVHGETLSDWPTVDGHVRG